MYAYLYKTLSEFEKKKRIKIIMNFSKKNNFLVFVFRWKILFLCHFFLYFYQAWFVIFTSVCRQLYVIKRYVLCNKR